MEKNEAYETAHSVSKSSLGGSSYSYKNSEGKTIYTEIIIDKNHTTGSSWRKGEDGEEKLFHIYIKNPPNKEAFLKVENDIHYFKNDKYIMKMVKDPGTDKIIAAEKFKNGEYKKAIIGENGLVKRTLTENSFHLVNKINKEGGFTNFSLKRWNGYSNYKSNEEMIGLSIPSLNYYLTEIKNTHDNLKNRNGLSACGLAEEAKNPKELKSDINASLLDNAY